MNEMNSLITFLGGAMISVGLGFQRGSIPVAVIGGGITLVATVALDELASILKGRR